MEIPLPPLDEQRHIAAILGPSFDTIRAKRRSSIEQFDELAASAFTAAFGDGSELADCAARRSRCRVVWNHQGATHFGTDADGAVPRGSQCSSGLSRTCPPSKKSATEAEIARYELEDGDLVLTEGGDPDKLGRGTVWRKSFHSVSIRTTSFAYV